MVSKFRLNACRSTPRPARRRGFTLLELLMALTVVGLLAAIALPSYAVIIQRQKVAEAGRELQEIAMAIERYRTTRFELPDTLTELGVDADLREDPWGRQYQFLSFNSSLPGIAGLIRKDHNLHPLNTEFDLYSLGKDGQSRPPLTAASSRDDVIWARDGGFVGIAEDF
jgi:general secretion pathway protein G